MLLLDRDRQILRLQATLDDVASSSDPSSTTHVAHHHAPPHIQPSAFSPSPIAATGSLPAAWEEGTQQARAPWEEDDDARGGDARRMHYHDSQENARLRALLQDAGDKAAEDVAALVRIY